jgi:hypothetical protein
MLRIERSGGSGDLLIATGKKDFFVTTPLFYAFLMAISFHAFGFLLFRIVPFTLSPTFQHPIIQVDMEPFAQECLVFALQEDERDLQEQLFPSMNIYPSHTFSCDWKDPISEKSNMMHCPIANLHADLFQCRGQSIWADQNHFLPLENLTLEEPVVDLRIDGRLSQFSLQSVDPLLEAMQPFQVDRLTEKLYYFVQMDEKTGTIIWFQKKESNEQVDKRSQMEEMAERIIRNLRFVINKECLCQFGFISGELDFTFFGEFNKK